MNCLSFSTDGNYLASTSSTETVHIFKLIQPSQERYSTVCTTHGHHTICLYVALSVCMVVYEGILLLLHSQISR